MNESWKLLLQRKALIWSLAAERWLSQRGYGKIWLCEKCETTNKKVQERFNREHAFWT